MRILIADDDPVSTLMLSKTVERWGYDPLIARDGLEAWEHITGKTPPELAIIDWMMPKLDGIELCTRVRAMAMPNPLYLILLTARTRRQDLVAGLEAGADDYLTKPFDPDELRARIHVGVRTLGLISSIKRLSGLLPICSYCKRIRSDGDYWEQVERYISEHTDARFSHGICPDCLTKEMLKLDAETSAAPRPKDV